MGGPDFETGIKAGIVSLLRSPASSGMFSVCICCSVVGLGGDTMTVGVMTNALLVSEPRPFD